MVIRTKRDVSAKEVEICIYKKIHTGDIAARSDKRILILAVYYGVWVYF